MTIPAARTLELRVEHTGRAVSLICRGALDACGAARLGRAIDAALEHPFVLVYVDLEDVASIDAAGARLVAATIRRCTAQRVHLELWPGIAVARMLVASGVPLPRRAYPSRPCHLAAGLGVESGRPDSGPHPVRAIPTAAPQASIGP